MLTNPMDVLTMYPVRKTKQQKHAFRDAVCIYAEKLGYPVTVESGDFGCRNVIFGDPEQAKYRVTAHYDWLYYIRLCACVLGLLCLFVLSETEK